MPEVAPAGHRSSTVAARTDLYGDAVNEAVFMRPGQYLTRCAGLRSTTGCVDGLVNGLGRADRRRRPAGSRRLQTGFARSYALSMLGGAALVVGALAAGEALAVTNSPG